MRTYCVKNIGINIHFDLVFATPAQAIAAVDACHTPPEGYDRSFNEYGIYLDSDEIFSPHIVRLNINRETCDLDKIVLYLKMIDYPQAIIIPFAVEDKDSGIFLDSGFIAYNNGEGRVVYASDLAAPDFL